MKRKQKSGSVTEPKVSRCSVLENISITRDYQKTNYEKEFMKEFEKAAPFPHICLRNFIDNSSNFVELLENELQEFPNWQRKENDLYSLYQTTDFKNIPSTSQPNMFALLEFLRNVVRPWLQKMTGVELTEQIDVTGSCYAETDHLLPHNDQIETRRFAFVYYVTEALWSNADGGALWLYKSDGRSMPTTVGKTILPLRNSFLLFEVTEKSWHQVEEVLQADKPRLSVNGWFHSSRRLQEVVPPTEVLDRFAPNSMEHDLSHAFLMSTYKNFDKLSGIRTAFEEKSEVLLTSFFQTKVYEDLVNLYQSESFILTGPPNKRRIFRLKGNPNPKNQLGRFYQWLSSKHATQYFENLTGCSLEGCEVSLQTSRIEKGCYTVMGDEDANQAADEGHVLEIYFFFGTDSKFSNEVGGSMVYVAKDEEDELMHVNPTMNAVAIIFKEPDVFSFLKYVTHKVSTSFFLTTLRYYHVEIDDE